MYSYIKYCEECDGSDICDALVILRALLRCSGGTIGSSLGKYLPQLLIKKIN